MNRERDMITQVREVQVGREGVENDSPRQVAPQSHTSYPHILEFGSQLFSLPHPWVRGHL